MSKKNGSDQLNGSGLLYFDPVYRAKQAEKPAEADPNASPQFPPNPNPDAPYAVIPAAQVHEDGSSVTVSIYEPEAKEVLLLGKGFPLPVGPYPMEKQKNGYFTYTFTGLKPDLYQYEFQVDGVKKLNPEAPIVFGCSTLVHCFEVPDLEDQRFQLCQVPHGQLRQELLWSQRCGRYRACWVYTPPEYDAQPDREYPVLYLQHGGGENEAAWFFTARANYLADNLLAQGKMEPMLIVCSTGFAPTREEDGSYREESFEQVFLQEIMPQIESRYRIRRDRLCRAMAGLSMGAGQSRYLVHKNPELFAWLGQFSSGAGFIVKSETGYYGRPVDYSDLFSSPEHFNRLMKLTFVSCGTEDPRHEYTSRQCQELADQGFHVEYHAYPGHHEWKPWRMSLADFLPRLFR